MKKSLETLWIKYGSSNPWTPVYGLARSLMALGTLLTLLFNDTNILFISLDRYFDHESLFASSLIDKTNLFLLFGADGVWAAKITAIIILVSVLSGWRPRITGLLHFWVSISFSTLSGTIDGGDTITSIFTFFLIPVCLSDGRRSHWTRNEPKCNIDPYIRLFIFSILFVLRIQACIIYLHAGIDKLRIEEWANGTSTYYWFTNTAYGVSDWLKPFVVRIMSFPIVVVLFTWGTILFELLLGMIIMRPRTAFNWKVLFWCGVLFHAGIVLIFGLISFFLAMSSVLVLYLVPVNSELNEFVPLIKSKRLFRLVSAEENDIMPGHVVSPTAVQS